MNKKNLFLISLFIIWFIPCNAQQRTIERIYISTDRVFYIAGEHVWLSLYCFDILSKKHSLSELSKVAYVELRNGATLISSAKLHIIKGRGSGKIEIPPSLPTGNYRLIAYTRQMFNENELNCFDKIISIVNTLTTERVPQNVSMKDEAAVENVQAYSEIDSKHLDVILGVEENTIPLNSSLPISLINKSDDEITLNISIVKVDLPAQHTYSLSDFFSKNLSQPTGITFNNRSGFSSKNLSQPAGITFNNRSGLFSQNLPQPTGITFNNRYLPELEGEIISGRIKNREAILSSNPSIFLSAIGTEVEVYSASVDSETGIFSFFTNSLFGNREIALEYPSSYEIDIELFDPFYRPPVQSVPVLYLDRKFEPFLVQRSLEMQVNHHFGIDTLFDQSIISNDPFLSNNKPVVYELDHYVRFPTMLDIIVEFVSELRLRKMNSQSSLQVHFESNFGWGNAIDPLVVIDGIAIFDHERLLQYDPLKVKTMTIYKNDYRIGSNLFSGIAKLNTYTGKYPGLSLGKNALILDFQGVQYPCRFTGNALTSTRSLPDMRSLLYWDPQIDIMNGETHEIMLKTSSIPGKYALVIEGVTANGQVVSHRSEFTVK